jgi:predicted metal-binding membrane protein
MTIGESRDLEAASGNDRGLARGFATRLIAWALVASLVAASWAYLALMIADMLPGRDMGALGPGMAILNLVNGMASFDETTRALFAALCALPGASHFGMPALGAWGVRDVAIVFLMWAAMSGAMMLPTAAPMITTYAEIADTAGHAGRRTVPIALLVTGYLAVWLGFALLATLAQWAATAALLLSPHMTVVSPVLTGALFLVAGAYQFTPLKHACLARCRSPFPVLFGRWSDRPADVLRLGLEQGALCLGCCWALMLLMFAVGLMNVVWMAVLGVLMMLEKLTTGRFLPTAIGVVLIGIGAVTWGWILFDKGVLRF